MQPRANFEDVQIPLPEPVHGIESVRGVLGVPEWWPTGERIAVVFGHSSVGSFEDPLVAALASGLAERGYLTLRFNFPFAEASKRAASDPPPRPRTRLPGGDRRARSRPDGAACAAGAGRRRTPGARVAAGLVADRVHADGLFLLGFPLHPQDKPDKADPEVLFKATSPMLFVQGTRDRRCDGEALRTALRRVGAPIELYDVEEADANFHVPKRSARDERRSTPRSSACSRPGSHADSPDAPRPRRSACPRRVISTSPRPWSATCRTSPT
ncbi:MAG: alpha/beta family hydrolase [Myxococcota bacterium]